MARYQDDQESKQEFIEVMGSDLGQLFNLLAYECNLLHLKWSEYRELFGANPKRIELLNQAAPSFFFLLQGILWEDVLLCIARLFDPPKSGENKENITLLTLPEMIDSEIQPRINSLLEDAKRLCKFSHDWRNRRIAHRDLNLALEETVKPLASASRQSVSAALESIDTVLNGVEFYYFNDRTTDYTFMHSTRGAKALLYVLRDGLDARIARNQRQMSGNPLPEDIGPRRPI